MPAENARPKFQPRVLVAPATFKGTLTAAEAASAMALGVKDAFPGARLSLCPLADGGEGTVDAIHSAAGGRLRTARVHAPLGRKTKAKFLVLPRRTALIEMAQASGLLLVPEKKRNPALATTYGTGQLILAALDAGCRNFIIGIGGSATNDGGAGMAQALGARFLDARGEEISFRKREGYCALSLEKLSRIDASRTDARIRRCRFVVASDVTNPLCGKQGAAMVYSKQKGATPRMAKRLDRIMRSYAETIKRDSGKDVLNRKGSGAAGGLGAGLFVFLGAKFGHGADLVMQLCGFEEKLKRCDFVITGEGCIDAQTSRGKAIARIAMLARKRRKPAVAIGGKLGKGYRKLFSLGFRRIEYATPKSGKRLFKNKCFYNLRKKTASVMRESFAEGL